MIKVLIFTILCIIGAKVSCKKALLFNLETRSLADVCDKDDKNCPPYLTACPAFTPREMQFNKNFSLGRKSLFSRLVYAKKESARNILVNFCEKSIKPTMLYDTEDNHYEIGYELYFEEGKINMTDKTYHRYKPVNTKKGKGDKIMNVTIPSSDGLIVKYEDEKDVKFNFTDRSRSLVFYWIEVLSIKSSKHKKRITIGYSWKSWQRRIATIKDKCENYGSHDDALYSKENQKKYLSDISVPASFHESNPDIECGQHFGCLEKYQILPLWFFDSSSARLASCSYMNVIPVWKSLADQLRKVDLYVLATLQHLRPDVIFGVSGILKINTSTKKPSVPRKMYLLDSKSRRKVAIPKIIYRIIKITSNLRYSDEFTAAIIFHNDPTADPNVDKLCINETLSGWDKISNNDSRTGLTYVCPVYEKLNDELGPFDDLTINEMQPLTLDSVPYYRSYTYPCEEDDKAVDIDEDFEKLVEASKIIQN